MLGLILATVLQMPTVGDLGPESPGAIVSNVELISQFKICVAHRVPNTPAGTALGQITFNYTGGYDALGCQKIEDEIAKRKAAAISARTNPDKAAVSSTAAKLK
jgi:hypothetical protein